MVATFLVALTCIFASSAQTTDLTTIATERIRSWARTVTGGSLEPSFDDNGWMGVGPLSFELDATTGRVDACAWIASSDLDAPPTPAETGAFARMERALNDPEIGGMFERAGGTFRWDRSVDAFLLCKPIELKQTTQREFDDELEELLDVALEWKLQWFYEVALVVHQGKPAPAHRQERRLLMDDE